MTDDSRNALAESNMGLAVQLARAAYGVAPKLGDVCLEDLIQAAMLGLIKAAATFDPERGVKFSTYAAPRIKRYIQRPIRQSLRNREKIVRLMDRNSPIPGLPCKANDIAWALASLNPREYEAIALRYAIHGGRPMTCEDICRKTGLKRWVVKSYIDNGLARLRKLLGDQHGDVA
jgi:DNA-directed RNA polymerase sigma subunit (sigma70/sigma32)